MQAEHDFVIPLQPPRDLPGPNAGAAVGRIGYEGGDNQNSHRTVSGWPEAKVALTYRNMTPQAISSLPLRRVYLVSWWFADFGGMERHIAELAKSLHSSGVTVTVFTEMPVPHGNQYRKELRQAGIVFVSPKIPRRLVTWWQQRFPARPSTASETVSQAMGNSFLARLLKFTLERRLQRETPDVVHVHGWLLRQWVVTWCASRGIPAVYTEHSTISDWGGPDIADAPTFMASAGEVACVSESARQSLAPWLPGRSISIHRHIVRMTDCEHVFAADDRVRLLCVARLRAEKGLDILLRVAAQLCRQGIRFQLEIAGDGPMFSELRALSAELGLGEYVVFSRSSNARGVREKMCGAHIFVLASRTEAMPLAVLEAMSHGMAIVATAVGGIPEVIFDGETGLLVPVESVDPLVSAIERLISDSLFREELGMNARRQFASGPYSEAAGLRSVLASYENARNGVLAG